MKRSELKLLIKEIVKCRLSEVSANKYTVIYAIAGLENIDQSEHDTREQALNAARSFIQSYNTQKSKLAGERMVRIDDGYCLKDGSGATVGIATVIDSRGSGEERMQERQQAMNELVNEMDGLTPQSLIDGQSNNVAASRVNKILQAASAGMFSDDSWEAINNIFKKLKEAGLNVSVTDAKYGGHADTQSGMPKYKEWQISIPFTNKNGKPTVLVGQITAHGAGSVEQPLDRYDITAYVSPMSVR